MTTGNHPASIRVAGWFLILLACLGMGIWRWPDHSATLVTAYGFLWVVGPRLAIALYDHVNQDEWDPGVFWQGNGG